MINGQPVQTMMTQELERINVLTEHLIGEEGNVKNYPLGIGEESLGTNQLFYFRTFFERCL